MHFHHFQFLKFKSVPLVKIPTKLDLLPSGKGTKQLVSTDVRVTI